MPFDREELLRVLVPIVVGVILTVLFFAIFDRWNQVHDPINSIVVTDDALLVEIVARKCFSERPRLTATVIPLATDANGPPRR